MRSTHRTFRNDPDGLRLPVKLDATSNGEFAPIPLDAVHRLANETAMREATRHARGLGLSRREFLVSAAGTATALLAMNAAYAAAGNTGGSFAIAAAAARDPDLARAQLGRGGFIFDVQGHFVDPGGQWLKDEPQRGQGFLGFPGATRAGETKLEHLAAAQFVKDVFLDSETDCMVLSFVPSTFAGEPLTIREATACARIVEKLEGTRRLLIHGRVNPNQDGDLERMDELAERWKISAWKTYTQFGPDGRGYFLSDPPGIAMIEKARKLGIKVVCVHKGIPFGRRSYEHSLCDDIGVVAARFPDVKFLIYHSGFVPGQPEGPRDPSRNEGVDSLVNSLAKNGVKAGSNVYAELGSTWRFVMRDPTSAAHTIGKLVKSVGEDNLLWGTDSIWYGSPQDQIDAFRAFRISAELRDKHGYAELTPALKRKVFGLNALKVYSLDAVALKKYLAGDSVDRARAAYAGTEDPAFATYGPKTRAEYRRLGAA
jgi:predicted TIM-barrel fold metal-dependent hydrolase